MTIQTQLARTLATFSKEALIRELSRSAHALGQTLPLLTDPDAKRVVRGLASGADDAAAALGSGDLRGIAADPFMTAAVVTAGFRLGQP